MARLILLLVTSRSIFDSLSFLGEQLQAQFRNAQFDGRHLSLNAIPNPVEDYCILACQRPWQPWPTALMLNMLHIEFKLAGAQQRGT